MDNDKKQQIVSFLRERIADADARVRFYAFENEKKRPLRDIYASIKDYLDKFLAGEAARRWVILTGLRGAGKTTLMSQIFLDAPREAKKLFLSADQVVSRSVTLREILAVYQTDFLGMSFAAYGQMIFLFLDEIQYDKDWGMTLKEIYDNAPNVFIFATGSSAMALNMNVDVARRPIFEKMFPLSFAEFGRMRGKTFNEVKARESARNVFLNAGSAREIYQGLKASDPIFNNLLAEFSNKDFNDYITYASLPSLVNLKEPVLAYDQVKNILDRVVGEDILQTEEFSAESLNKIKDILYIASGADKVSYSAIGGNAGIGLHYMTVSRIFDILQQTEVLTRVLPYSASHNTQIRQASKFLFSASAFRAMHFHLRGSVLSPDESRGKLLEDVVGMHIIRMLHKQKDAYLTYDAESGGADFVVGSGAGAAVIEVGANKKTSRQVIKTRQKAAGSCGVIISEHDEILGLDETNEIVKIPLKYFLLM
jgi:predicted AAA+ superfamily ATPase